jgi:uncharacterized membrane-anchored protein YitT (DUF2179 family)
MLAWRQSLQVVAGSLLAALGYAAFQVPHGIAAGGVTGLAIILKGYLPFSVGIAVWLMNVPMLALGFHYLGRWTFLWRTVLAVTVFSLSSDAFLRWLPSHVEQWPLTHNVLLSAIYAGVIGGLGLGLVFRAGSSLGGTGVVGRILQARWGVPLSSIYLCTDGGIIALAGLVLGWESALVALVTLFINGLASDHALEGPSTVRTAFIVTQSPQRLATALIAALGRGATYWDVVGGYSGSRRAVVLCTVHRPQIQQLKEIVRQVDPEAFLTIGISHQAYGGGFELACRPQTSPLPATVKEVP